MEAVELNGFITIFVKFIWLELQELQHLTSRVYSFPTTKAANIEKSRPCKGAWHVFHLFTASETKLKQAKRGEKIAGRKDNNEKWHLNAIWDISVNAYKCSQVVESWDGYEIAGSSFFPILTGSPWRNIFQPPAKC